MTGAFLKGQRTPDGPLVTYHRPGEEPLAFPDPALDWGSPPEVRTLARTLIGNLVSPYLPEYIVDSFIDRFLFDPPQDGWVIPFDEIDRWKASYPDWTEETERRRRR